MVSSRLDCSERTNCHLDEFYSSHQKPGSPVHDIDVKLMSHLSLKQNLRQDFKGKLPNSFTKINLALVTLKKRNDETKNYLRLEFQRDNLFINLN